MKIIYEPLKFFNFAFEYEFSYDLLNFCRRIKDSYGWKKFNFYESKWRFNDPLIIEDIKLAYPNVEIDHSVLIASKEKQIQEEQKKVNEVKLLEIKNKKKSDLVIPGFKGELYDYQKIGVEFLLLNKGRGMLFDQPGLGKSSQSLGYIVAAGRKKSLVICPASVKPSWKKEIEKWTKLKSIILDSKTEVDVKVLSKYDVFIINYDSLKTFFDVGTVQKLTSTGKIKKTKVFKLKDLFNVFSFDCLVADEAQYCFPFDTLIETNIGKIKIGDIVENKLDLSVKSFNPCKNVIEYKKILNHFKVFGGSDLIRIRHENGEIVSTKEHKIYANNKWKEASTISYGENLRILRKKIYGNEERINNGKILLSPLFIEKKQQSSSCFGIVKKEQSSKDRKKMSNLRKNFSNYGRKRASNKEEILRTQLFGKVEDEPRMGETNVEEEYKNSPKTKNWNKKSSSKKKNDIDEQGQRIQQKKMGWISQLDKDKPNFFQEKRRKWNRVNDSTKKVNVINRNEDRIYSENKSCKEGLFSLAKSLQNRPCECRENDSSRNRWSFSQSKRKKDARQEEGCCLVTSRVESVEVLKSRSNGKSGNGCKKNKFVYNIEVAENNNYFANNVLVSNCKEGTSARTRMTRMLSDKVESVILLSGTPIMNRPKELFSMLNIINKKTWGNFMDYTKRYCDGHYGRWGWECDGASNLDELRSRISPYFLRRLKKDVATELPPKRFIDIPVELEYEQRIAYDKAERDLVEFLRSYKGKTDEEIQKSMQAEKLVLLNSLRYTTSMGKIDAARDIINNLIENDEKVLVFSVYNEPLEILYKEFKKGSVMITGKTPQLERGEAVEKFQNDKNIKVFFGGTKSAGTGITLTAASNVIFLDFSWVPADHEQALDRVHRWGQKADEITCYQLYADKTVDEKMKTLLETKKFIADTVIDGGEDSSSHSKELISELLKSFSSYDK